MRNSKIKTDNDKLYLYLGLTDDDEKKIETFLEMVHYHNVAVESLVKIHKKFNSQLEKIYAIYCYTYWLSHYYTHLSIVYPWFGISADDSKQTEDFVRPLIELKNGHYATNKEVAADLLEIYKKFDTEEKRICAIYSYTIKLREHRINYCVFSQIFAKSA